MTRLTVKPIKGPVEKEEVVDKVGEESLTLSDNSEEVEEDPLTYNVGESDYSSHAIQPWHIWEEYDLNPWDADIIKRILRTKKVKGMTKKNARLLDYEKIIHICKFRINQIERNGL
jgi:hypothetical protein